MTARTERGFLILADFSGYTSFMAKAELDHAQEIIRELLELVSSRLTSPLTLIEVEGDALFLCAPADRIRRRETVLELLESAYVAFRDRLGTIKRHTKCGCIACNSVQTLDLKFFTHYGEYVPQRIAGSVKLIGSSVNLLHRLVKNHISAATGWKGYALFTADALGQLGIRPIDFHTSSEQYEHLGEIVVHTQDLHKRYRELTAARRVFIDVKQADAVREKDFPCTPPVLWEWLNDPHKRNAWMVGTTWMALARPAGRTAPGATNHCAHGKKTSIEQIVDWRPFEYFSTEVREGPMLIRDTVVLTPIADGTHLSHRICIEMPLPRFLIKPLTAMVVDRAMKLDQCWANIERLVTEEALQESVRVHSPLQE